MRDVATPRRLVAQQWQRTRALQNEIVGKHNPRCGNLRTHRRIRACVSKGWGRPEGVASAPATGPTPFGVIDRHFVDDKRGSGVPRLWAYVSISPATATVCTPEG